jgi:heme exporter protein C
MKVTVLITSFVLMIASGMIANTKGAIEPVVRNIVYIHVPASICSLVCFGGLFVFSIMYLIKKKPVFDHLGAASAEVAFVFATVLNITGMIFAKAEWGLWWTPSMRLISSAILWFLAAAYLILRSSFNEQGNKANLCAVFGIIAFVDVPFVYISARMMRDIHRPSFSLDSNWQSTALGLAILATIMLASTLIWMRADIEKLNEKLN